MVFFKMVYKQQKGKFKQNCKNKFSVGTANEKI